jgi:amino acid transporter
MRRSLVVGAGEQVSDECWSLLYALCYLPSLLGTMADDALDWSFQIAKRNKTVLSFITGWIWLIGNWTITLSVNFGFASLIAATVSMYHPDLVMSNWQLTLIFFAICLITLVICAFGNSFLPMVDS